MTLAGDPCAGIRAVKLGAWEDLYEARIAGLRTQEMAAIRAAALLNIFNTLIFIGGPIVVSLTAFATYALLGYRVTAAAVFPALALFNLLRFPILMCLPAAIPAS